MLKPASRPRALRDEAPVPSHGRRLVIATNDPIGAGEGNRTLVNSLGSCRITIMLRPRPIRLPWPQSAVSCYLIRTFPRLGVSQKEPSKTLALRGFIKEAVPRRHHISARSRRLATLFPCSRSPEWPFPSGDAFQALQIRFASRLKVVPAGAISSQSEPDQGCRNATALPRLNSSV